MFVRFLVGSVTFHLLYFTLKNIVVPAFFSDETARAVIAEIAKRSELWHAYIFHFYTRSVSVKSVTGI